MRKRDCDSQDNNAESRIQSIELYLKKMGEESHLRVVDHVYTGGPGNRHMAPLSIVEFPSQSIREQVLKKINDGNPSMKDSQGNTIDIKRAKTSWQLKRNAALKSACDLLKKDSRCKDKSVEISWKIDSSKNRSVKVDGEIIFQQCPSDCSGNFQNPFQDLSI